jgi:hypothetical protein
MCDYKDGPRNTAETIFSAIPVRLEMLEERINKWKYLDWDVERISLPEVYLDPVVVGGVCALLGADAITCCQLPSRANNIPSRTWAHNTDFDILEVSWIDIDPGQDLLLLLRQ